MKRSDFIPCNFGVMVHKSTVEWYTKYERTERVLFGGRDKWTFNGTIEEFEALLFDDESLTEYLAKTERIVRIETLKWACDHCSLKNECITPEGCNSGEALIRLQNGGDL